MLLSAVWIRISKPSEIFPGVENRSCESGFLCPWGNTMRRTLILGTGQAGAFFFVVLRGRKGLGIVLQQPGCGAATDTNWVVLPEQERVGGAVPAGLLPVPHCRGSWGSQPVGRWARGSSVLPPRGQWSEDFVVDVDTSVISRDNATFQLSFDTNQPGVTRPSF